MRRLLLMCLLVSGCGHVQAQAPDEGLLLAMVFVSEAGFIDTNRDPDGSADHLAIANYTRALARYWRLPMSAALVRRYTRALAPEEARRNRPWLANLSRAPGAPRGWREDRMRWADRDAQWRATLDLADAFLAGRVDAPDGCRPNSWGSPVYDADDIARTLARGGRVIDCGRTRNVFLRW